MQKDVYPYEHMDDWERFNEKLLPEEEKFHSHLPMEDISNADFAHAKKVYYKDFDIKHLGECHD